MTREDIIHKGITAALSLAAETPWADLTLKRIADKAGVSISDFHGVADKADLAAGMEAYFDKAMSEGSFESDETPRTRLFDVIMMRFEAMEEARDGVISYLKWRDRSLTGLTNRVTGRAATAHWALSCSGLDGGKSIPLPLKITGLAWAIGKAEQSWKQETSPDLTRTMATLDSELITLGERAKWLKPRRKAEPQPQDSAAEESS
ncbi:MAG: hypothetical protein AAGB16_07695 [Pseudomonadota bacterium]